MQSLLRHQLACSSKSSTSQSAAVRPTRSRQQRTSTVTYSIDRDVASSAALQDSLTTAQETTTAAEVNISQPTPQISAGPSAQTSKCPLFNSQAASADPKDAQAVKEALRDLPHGPGWAVIHPNDIDGEDFSMPLPQGRFCWNPLLGDVTEVSKGMGPFLLERYREFGPVFSWQMGQMKVISILDYETIKSIMQYDGRVVKAWGSESMYAILGDIARVQFDNPEERVVARKMQAPGFTAQAIAEYIPKIVSITSSQLDEWATAGSFDLAKDTKDLSFEFSTQLLVNFAVPKEQKAMLREKFDRMFTAMIALPIKVPGSEYMRGIEARAQVIEDIKALLAIKKQQEQQLQQQQGRTGSEQHKASVLDTMLEAFKYLTHLETPSDDDIASTGVTLIIAGNDTSGLGIMGMLGLLALKPEVMQKLREEQDKVVASHGESIDRHALEAMPYADAVAREALRITPPAPQLFRRTLVPMQIGGHFIPAGSILSLGFYIAQMLTDPGLHKHHTSSSSNGSSSGMASYLDQIPEHDFGVLPGQALQKEFNPDRWLAKPSSGSSSSTGKPSGLLTFGTGRHECLGRGLFMNEAKVLLALLARNYELELERPEDFAFRMGFVVEPPKDCVVKVHKRK